MPESDPISDGWDAYQQQLERARADARETMAGICDALTKLGAAEVFIDYDGYGDSGTIGNIAAEGKQGDVQIPDEIRDKLVSAALHLLPDGWANDSGAFGEFVLDVANRRLTREHTWRSTRYDEDVWQL